MDPISSLRRKKTSPSPSKVLLSLSRLHASPPPGGPGHARLGVYPSHVWLLFRCGVVAMSTDPSVWISALPLSGWWSWVSDLTLPLSGAVCKMQEGGGWSEGNNQHLTETFFEEWILTCVKSPLEQCRTQSKCSMSILYYRKSSMTLAEDGKADSIQCRHIGTTTRGFYSRGETGLSKNTLRANRSLRVRS